MTGTVAETDVGAAMVAYVRRRLAEADREAIPTLEVADELAGEFDVEFDVTDPSEVSRHHGVAGPLLTRVLYHADLLPHPRFGDVEWVTEDRHDKILRQDGDRHDRELVQCARSGTDMRRVTPALIMLYSPMNAKQRAERERDDSLAPLLAEDTN